MHRIAICFLYIDVLCLCSVNFNLFSSGTDRSDAVNRYRAGNSKFILALVFQSICPIFIPEVNFFALNG